MSMRMKRASIVTGFAALAVGCALAGIASLSSPGVAQAAPRSFFGIVPQAPLEEEDVRYMRAARIGTVRLPIGWDSGQPTPTGGPNSGNSDREGEAAPGGRVGSLCLL